MDQCLPKEGRGVVLSGASWESPVQQGAEPKGLHQQQRMFCRCAVLLVGARGHAFCLGLQQQLPVEWAGRGSGERHLPGFRASASPLERKNMRQLLRSEDKDRSRSTERTPLMSLHPHPQSMLPVLVCSWTEKLLPKHPLS